MKKFSHFEGGLLENKLKQLDAVKEIDQICLSTNDEEVISIAQSLNLTKLLIDIRDDRLCSSSTSTDELIEYAGKILDADHVLWTHVTAPFFNENSYRNIIADYKSSLATGYDSLMTTTLLRSFIWNEKAPINYNRAMEKWPRTQTLEPLHEINSAAFIAPITAYRELHDRIGLRPKLYPIDKIEGFDIDWDEDCAIAEMMMNEIEKKSSEIL